jgi:hypothetical protein
MEKKVRVTTVGMAMVLCVLLIAQANAVELRNFDPNNRNTSYVGVFNNIRYLFDVRLAPSPAKTVVLDQQELNLLRSDFSTWTFTNETLEAPGYFDVIYYDAGLAELVWDPNINRYRLVWEPTITNDMEIDYVTNATPPGPGYALHWIQFVYTNDPILGDTSPAIDPTTWNGVQNWEDGLPFYWTEQQNATNSNIAGVVLRFTDRPARSFERAVELAHIWWEAHLYLVIWNEDRTNGNVRIYPTGVRWGFDITAAATNQAVPRGTLKYTHGGVAGDKYDWDEGEHLNDTSVGGFVVAVDKTNLLTGLLAPYIGVASTILAATVATAICVRRVKRRREKQ